MCRLKTFESLGNHLWYSKIVKKLKVEDKKFCLQFLKENAHLDKNDYAHKVNRLFIDQDNKPKNATLIWEVLSVTGSMQP